MLTALSVARECHMVKENDKIILVQALPPQLDKTGNPSAAPQIEYVYTDQSSVKTAPMTKSFKVSDYSTAGFELNRASRHVS